MSSIKAISETVAQIKKKKILGLRQIMIHNAAIRRRTKETKGTFSTTLILQLTSRSSTTTRSVDDNMYAFLPSTGRSERISVSIFNFFYEFFIGVNGNLPWEKRVGKNVIKCRSLFLLYGFPGVVDGFVQSHDDSNKKGLAWLLWAYYQLERKPSINENFHLHGLPEVATDVVGIQAVAVQRG